jgi:hypothetical protein
VGQRMRDERAATGALGVHAERDLLGAAVPRSRRELRCGEASNAAVGAPAGAQPVIFYRVPP